MINYSGMIVAHQSNDGDWKLLIDLYSERMETIYPVLGDLLDYSEQKQTRANTTSASSNAVCGNVFFQHFYHSFYYIYFKSLMFSVR